MKFAMILLGMCATLVLTACASTDVSKTARTATEQLLISTAIDRAVADIRLPQIKGRRIKLVDKNFESVDKPYAYSAIYQRLLEEGAEVYIEPPAASTDTSKAKEDDAVLVVEISSGGIGTNQSSVILGIPSIPVALPFTNTAASLPEMSFYKSANQVAIAKLNIYVYDSEKGLILASQRNVAGYAYLTYHDVLMLITWNASNLEPNVTDAFSALTFDYESPNKLKK